MTLFARFAPQGGCIGLWDAAINLPDTIPGDAVPITPAQRDQILPNPGQWRWDSAAQAPVAFTPPISLDASKANATAQVQVAADALYRAMVPNALTQEAYNQKARIVQAGAPPSDGPVHDQLAAEAAAKGVTVDQLFAQIKAKADAYGAGILALPNITRDAASAIATAQAPDDVAKARDAALKRIADLGAQLAAA